MKNKNKIERRLLEDILLSIDKHSPKPALNYCYVDTENIVSTNTKVLCVAKHNLNIKEPFFIQRAIVEKAVKERKANYFIISENKITALKNKDEIITFSINVSNIKNLKFPNYTKIIPNQIKEKISFVDNSQINGLFAFKRVNIDSEHIPNAKYGYIGINDKNLPVLIEDREYQIKTIIMPKIDTFKEFETNGFI